LLQKVEEDDHDRNGQPCIKITTNDNRIFNLMYLENREELTAVLKMFMKNHGRSLGK
jgi:hypothetical protein